MLDPKYVLNNIDEVKRAIENKKSEKVDLDRWIELYNKKIELETELNELRSQRNDISGRVKSANDIERVKILEEAQQIKAKIQDLEKGFIEVVEEYDSLHLKIPNVFSPTMPIGDSEDDNVVVETFGDKPKFEFEPKDHVELGEMNDWIDMKTAAKVTGARFYYIKGDLARLQYALVSYVFETLSDIDLIKSLAKKVNHPAPGVFIPVLPPMMVRPEVMEKMDRLDPIDDRFRTQLDNLVLVGSAEHTMGPMYMDHTFNKEDLPVRMIGYSASFRRESGSYGRDTRGILRVHQFDKLEMETFVPEELGEVEQKLIVEIQKHLVNSLGLHFQLVQICSGDTGKPDYNQFDIETWIPTQGKFRETHTSDYMTDYQARRLSTRYKEADGTKYVHMNDATAFAMARTLIAIIENFQQEDGSVKVPSILVKYINKEYIK